MSFLTPDARLEARRLRPGLRALAVDHVFSQSMAALTSGVFMVSLVFALGGTNGTVGIIAAIGPIAQAVQIPAIFLVESLRRRRAITVLTAWTARLMFLVIAALPWLAPPSARIPLLLLAILIHCVLGAISGCSYSSWVRDVIPDRVMGRYMGRRLAWAIGAGAIVSLAVGFGITPLAGRFGPVLPHSVVFALAGLLGLIGTCQLIRVPEPQMPPINRGKLWGMLGVPLRDRPFRQLLRFSGWWAFAQNFAAPFFVVYMLERLELPLGVVVALSVLTQLMNVAFFPVWGRLIDRYQTKPVMGASGLLYVISFLFWPLMTLETTYWATWPLLVAAHLLMGVATAGVAVATGTLALKAAPRGAATSYLAVNALATGIGAALSPLLAGPLGDFFAHRELQLNLSWESPSTEVPLSVPAFAMRGLDFLFPIAFALGLYALHRLAAVREIGQVDEHTVLRELRHSLRRGVYSIAGTAGVRQSLHIPAAHLGQTSRTAGQGFRAVRSRLQAKARKSREQDHATPQSVSNSQRNVVPGPSS